MKDTSHDSIWRVNALSANFWFVNRQLLMSYCISFCGVCLWNLQDKCVEEFYCVTQRFQKTVQSTSLHSL